MTLIPGLAAAVLLVWALGGQFARVASLRFRRVVLLYAALAAQLVAFGPVQSLGERQVERVQLATYGLLLVFCVVNRAIPGLWLVALGVASNALVITVNGGAMPVDPSAIVASGWDLSDYAASYPNVVARGHAPLGFLGDVIAMPRFPGSAVLSIGDLVIVAGVWLMLQRVARRDREAAGRQTRVPRRRAARIVAGGVALLSGLAFIDPRSALLVGALSAGAVLGLVALAFAGDRPPPVRCLAVCALLAPAALLLAGSTGTLPTAVLGMILAGLAAAIGVLTAWRFLGRAPGGEVSATR